MLYVDTENYGRILASSLSLHRKDILQWGLSYEDLKLICLAVTSILLAAISAVIIKIYHATGNRRYRLLQKLTKKDHFEKVIIDNIITNNTSPKISCVAITLRSGKVYIGWFEDVSFEQGELNDFTITPLLSGYRNKENFALVITVNYLEHFELDRRFENFPDVVFKDYKVTIMKDQVDFISLFNAATYKRFQKNTIEYNSAYLDNQ